MLKTKRATYTRIPKGFNDLIDDTEIKQNYDPGRTTNKKTQILLNVPSLIRSPEYENHSPIPASPI